MLNKNFLMLSDLLPQEVVGGICKFLDEQSILQLRKVNNLLITTLITPVINGRIVRIAG